MKFPNINMKPTITTSIALLFTVAVLFSSCTPDKKEELKKLKTEQAELNRKIKVLEEEITKEDPNAFAVAVKAKEVTVSAIAPKNFDHYVQTQGRIESENNIMVSSKSMGVIDAVFVKEGQQISKGQVLAQIDNSVIERNIESMESQLELATTVYERQKNLWDQKIGTEVQYLQAKTSKESLEKQLQGLREQNEMTKIKSPIAGVVDEVQVKVGENIAPGMPAARIVNNSDLKLVANVSEAYVTDVKKGDKVIINVPEIRKEIVGYVSFVGRNIDPLSRTFTVEVNLKSQPELRPNMSATVKVVFNTAADAIVVPVNVIQTLNNEKVVYVAEKDGAKTVARKKVVTVDGVYNNMAQVQGLKGGDQIITFGYQGLNDGEVVKI
jgi:membrane fusion protein, multidrug efflux system